MAAVNKKPEYMKGIVKQVLSGDAVTVRGLKGKGGPPPERQIYFSNVVAPKVAKRAFGNQSETEDEPFGWEAREFLRKKLIGKEILFTVETKTPTGREYGALFIGTDPTSPNLQNVTELMIQEGLLTVRRESIRGESNLVTLEDAAKASGMGKWNSNASKQLRNVKWSLDEPRAYVEKFGGKPRKAIIEHVRDGSTVRAFILPDFTYVTIMISGIKCPMFKVDSDGKPDKGNVKPYAEEARFFVESRLLQRDVQVIIETSNNANLVGTIKHPNGNIAELLLREGFAKCISWSMSNVTGGSESLRAAEKIAKDKKLRVWADYKPHPNQLLIKDREIVGKVCEVVNADALVIRDNSGKTRKIFIASIRPPRLDKENENQSTRQTGKNFRPLYDIPWMFEAREFLRKKLIGQKVHATVDYVQPQSNGFPEKTCCTVKMGDTNIGIAMVTMGLATVIKYKQDDDQRASCYDELLSAETKAAKDVVGLHSKKDIPIHRVQDYSGDPSKAKNFFPFIQRAGRTDAVVEFVASGSRVRVYIPRETSLITFLLAGISCPKARRPAPGGSGTFIPGDEYGEEALEFTRKHIIQREVQIEVESMDKGGNFIGWLYIDDQNLSIMLVENGLSSVHVTAEGTKYFHQLSVAEESAKKKRSNIWANYVKEDTDQKVEEFIRERRVNHESVVVSEVTRDAHLFCQYVKDKPVLEGLMERLGNEFLERPPVGGSFTPRRGEICAAKFIDNVWYRAKVDKMSGGQVSISYIDYGNKEITQSSKLAPLPPQFSVQSLPPFAHEIALALVKLPKDDDYKEDAVGALMTEVMDRALGKNLEYKANSVGYYTLQRSDNKSDVAKTLLTDGLLMVDPRKEVFLQPLLQEYKNAQDAAKKKHVNIWRYGDVTEDDAFEFGMER